MSITPCRPKWNGTMSDRERFNNQMHYRPVDRCFNREFGYWEENFTQWQTFVEHGITNNREADRFFNFDRTEGISGLNFMWPVFDTSKIVSETETHKTFRDELGVLAEVSKDGSSSIPHFIEPSVKTPDDWARIKEKRFDPDHPDRTFAPERIQALQEQHPPARDYPLEIGCGSFIGKIRDMLTLEGLVYAIYDYPDMVEDMVETTCQLIEKSLDQLLPAFDFDFAGGWEDICCRNGPLVGMEFFRDIIVPRYKRIRKKFDRHGIDIWYIDCDGDVRPILPYLMEGGVNTLFPFEVNSCCHPKELLDEYGADLRIMGGFDKMQLIAGKEAIKKYMESLVPLVERGGYIPFCDHRCPPDVTYENYCYYLDLKETIFGMK